MPSDTTAYIGGCRQVMLDLARSMGESAGMLDEPFHRGVDDVSRGLARLCDRMAGLHAAAAREDTKRRQHLRELVA